MEKQEGIKTMTTQEPDAPQADPAATAARETATEPTPVHVPVSDQASTTAAAAPTDPLESLRAELHADLDVLADAMSTLTCHLIATQITAYRERRRALLAARKARHEVFALRAAVAAASKVTVSTSINLAALDVNADTAPEPPDTLAQITSQVAEQVMCSERAQTIPVTKEWSDDHTLAYLRLGWRSYSPEEQEENAVALINDVCNPHPLRRSATWIGLVRRVSLHGGVGSTPAEASAAKAKAAAGGAS